MPLFEMDTVLTQGQSGGISDTCHDCTSSMVDCGLRGPVQFPCVVG